jgi:hypothetical protein
MPARIPDARITPKNLRMQFPVPIARIPAFLTEYAPIVDFIQDVR